MRHRLIDISHHSDGKYMKMVCFGSSSSGNCYYAELNRKDGQPPVKLLLEAGIPYKEIVRKATNEGIDLTQIDAVLVTHSHMDHCRAVIDLQSRGAVVFANKAITGGTYKTTLEDGVLKVIAPNTTVLPFLVEHDAPDPFGFFISTGVERILFVNDCKYFKADLSKIQFDYIMIESNYDGQTIHFAYQNAKEEHDAQNIKRYERLINSHMSISHCIDQLNKLDLSHCKAIFLMHLSDRHANENVFKMRVNQATKIPTFVCKKCGGIV